MSDPIYTMAEWRAEAARLFGPDPLDWRFVCPSCGHVASVRDWRDAGAEEGAAAFSCVGRWLGADRSKTFLNEGGPCNYAGGGLFQLNPITIVDEVGNEHHAFAFAESLQDVEVDGRIEGHNQRHNAAMIREGTERSIDLNRSLNQKGGSDA